MSNKPAIVFDTNFIISHINELHRIRQQLSETYDVFVTDISIQERISQKYLELKKKYDEITTFARKYSSVATVSVKMPFERKIEIEKEHTETGYKREFGDNIIPFVPNKDTLFAVMDRVHKKVPPFQTADNSSDKGFKDTLLWLSLLDYFKDTGGDCVIFVTDDKGFRNNAEALCEEFYEATGKRIEIQDNGFYSSIISTSVEGDSSTTEPKKPHPLPDVSLLREKIHEIIESLCGFNGYDGWNERWYDTFTLNSRVSLEDIEIMFANLRKTIEDNLFETDIPASILLSLEDNIVNEAPIPITSLQNALLLYEDIESKMSDYLPQFFSATMNIINTRYKEPQIDTDIDDDDLPF